MSKKGSFFKHVLHVQHSGNFSVTSVPVHPRVFADCGYKTAKKKKPEELYRHHFSQIQKKMLAPSKRNDTPEGQSEKRIRVLKVVF